MEDPVTLGRYRVLGELGRGAMGVVYLAEDPSLKRGVAIKVVTSGGEARDEALARFRREAETAARLQHPNVVSIYDVGEEPGVGPFLAMEYIEGTSLQERVVKGPMPPEEAAEVLVQGALALEAAHRAGVLHRDIKPGNFMLGKDGRLKLMDFGIARMVDSTRATRLLCTPAFASPELLSGEGPSPASDRWAYAVTAFQVLTGAVPFGGSTVAATLQAIGTGSVDFRRLPEGPLRPVFERAFHPEAAQRHPDLRTFLTELVQALPLDREAQAHVLRPFGVRLGAPAVAAPRWLRWRWPALGGSVAAVLAGLWLAGPLSHRRITVTCAPLGAWVVVGGRSLGPSPVEDARIPPFARTLRITHPGFAPLERKLEPGEDRVVEQLVPLPFALKVQTDPPGASVYLNGKLRGRTPLELTVPGEGTHLLRVVRPGYQPYVHAVTRQNLPREVIHLKPVPEEEGPGAWVKKLFR
mgnify:CR=1 FL=1